VETSALLSAPPTPPGCEAYVSASGVRVLRIHYSADPDKDAAWAARVSAPFSKAEWQREFEMSSDVYDGKPVFEDFSEPIHCPSAILRGSWEPVKGSRYICGIDAGSTLWPAAVLIEIGPAPDYQIAAVLEVVSEGSEPMNVFAPRLMAILSERYPSFWADIQFVGDPSINQRSGTMGDSATSIARRYGLQIKPSTNVKHVRLSAVTWALTDAIEENTPRFYLCGKDCPTLLQGFRGAYRYREWQNADGRDRDLKEPLKDKYSHPQDALQYAMIEAKKLILNEGTRVHRANQESWTRSPSLPPSGPSSSRSLASWRA
jgi:hypothetical protein